MDHMKRSAFAGKFTEVSFALSPIIYLARVEAKNRLA